MSKTICVIDDDPDVQASVGDLLQSAGYRAALFDCAEAFLAESRPEVPVLILCDVNLPGISGDALLQRLRDQGNKIAVVLFTAYPTELIRRQARALGAGDLIEKPFDPDAMLDRVMSLCGPPDA